jgi:hypothetical protein
VATAATDETQWFRRMHGRLMMLGENDGLKGCAAHTGKRRLRPLTPSPSPQRLAMMPFHVACVRRQGSVMSTGPAVTFLTGRNCDFSNGDRQRRAMRKRQRAPPARRDPIDLDQRCSCDCPVESLRGASWRRWVCMLMLGAGSVVASSIQCVAHPLRQIGKAKWLAHQRDARLQPAGMNDGVSGIPRREQHLQSGTAPARVVR